MSTRAFRTLTPALVLILAASLFVPVCVPPGQAASWDGESGTLGLLAWDQPDPERLAPFAKDCWLLAHNQDLALILTPPDFPVAAEALAGWRVLAEPVRADARYFLYALSDPAAAEFDGDVQVLARRGHSLVLATDEEDPRLSVASRARLHGLVQPLRITLTPKVWPTADAAVPPSGERTEFHPLIDQMVAAITETNYVSAWQPLDNFETRYTYATTSNDAAANWMHAQFESFGLDAEFHTYSQSGTRKNVIGIHRGLVDPDRVVYMTGHFDSISDDPYNHAPGADDNASGTAAFLEAARVLSQYAFHYTIKFVGFNGEEQGLVGSAAYVNHIASQGENVIACFNLDMIAYAGTDPYPPDLIIYTNTASLAFANLLRDAVLEYVPQYVEPRVLVEAISASDHASFWDHGYRAILGIEEEAWGADFCPWYHTTNDRIENYPRNYPTYNTKATAAAVAHTAVPLNPTYPYLVLHAVDVDDDGQGSSQGNGNGVLEYGETVELSLTLQNVGVPNASGVQGTLGTADPYVTLLTPQSSFGNIAGNGGLATNSPPFLFRIDANVPDDHEIAFDVAISEAPDMLGLTLRAYSPELAIIAYDADDTAGGDGDGIPEPGEEIALELTARNHGSVGVTGVWGELLGGPYLDADSTPLSFGDLPPGGEATAGPFAVAISASCPALYTSFLSVWLRDGAAYERRETFPFNIGDIFGDDMETGLGWTHFVGGGGFSDQWHLETYRNHTYSGTRSWKCGGAGAADYGNLLHAVLESPPFTLPPNSTLTFWHWIEAEVSQSYPGYCYDGGLVQISIDGGAWQALTPQGGYPYRIRTGGTPGPFPAETPVFSGAQDWREETIDLAGHSGSARVRFVFGTDGAAVREGWYVDDVLLRLGTADIAATPRVVQVQLHPARPNPATDGVSLRLDLASAGAADVRVFDAAGREIRALFSGSLRAGTHALHWDGRDGADRRAGGGLYWIRATTPEARCATRVILVD